MVKHMLCKHQNIGSSPIVSKKDHLLGFIKNKVKVKEKRKCLRNIEEKKNT